jgi:RNA polymerase sigma-70 factor (ECF subfamily)
VAQLSDEAFAALYERNARSLWIYAYRITGNAADADDIVQETFVRVLPADLPDGDESARRYLFRVASNLATDRWRRVVREERTLRSADRPTAVTQRALLDDDVAQTFAALKPRDRALLWLAYVEGETHESIADALRLKRSSIKVVLSRARGRLRDLLRARGVDAKGSL